MKLLPGSDYVESARPWNGKMSMSFHATVSVDDDSSLQAHALTDQVWWLDLRVSSRLALFYVYQMNRVNSHSQNEFVTMSAA